MTHKERFHATIERNTVDRPASWLGIPTSYAIHPIQALAADMDAEHLKKTFRGKASFCGGVDAQNLLVHGTPETVRQQVRELGALLPTGLVISPSYEAIMPDIPPDNIEALSEAASGESFRDP